MDAEFAAQPQGEERELFVHLDIDGVAALLNAISTAMLTGRGELSPESYGPGGTIVGTGSTRPFARVTLTFDGPDSGGKMPN